jgi:hypothetical protein
VGLDQRPSGDGGRKMATFGSGPERLDQLVGRRYICEAAHRATMTSGVRPALKRWGLGDAKRIWAKTARVASGGVSASPGTLACRLLRLWRDGAHRRKDAAPTA